ncbi:hypothetical protein ACOSQ3_025911 [Xanthoceras sorbifolium]
MTVVPEGVISTVGGIFYSGQGPVCFAGRFLAKLVSSNCQLHAKPCPPAAEVLPWCASFLHDFSSAAAAVISVRGDKFVRWIPPIEGVVKINSDASVDSFDKGFCSIILETDASTVVKLINKEIQPLSEIDHVIGEILDYLLCFPSSVNVVFTSRSANLVAHSLARLVFQGLLL